MDTAADDPVNAEDHLGYAFALWSGALEIAPRADGNRVHAFYLLTGFSIELALKAYLIHAGRTEKLKSHDVRHDLAALLALSIQHRLSPNELVPTLVEGLSEHHKKFRFRYPDTGFVELHKPDFAIIVTERLLGDVARAIGLKARRSSDHSAKPAD